MMRQTDPLLDDEKAQLVFQAVARDRRVTFRRLTQQLTIDKQELREKLQRLKQAELVDESPSALDELTTYYLTSSGFSAERRLRRLDVSLRAFR